MKKTVEKSSNTGTKQTIDAKSFHETRSFLVLSLGIFIALNIATTFIVSIYMANSSGIWLWTFAALIFVDVLVCVYLILAFIKMPNPAIKKETTAINIEGKDSVKDILDDEGEKLKSASKKVAKPAVTTKPKSAPKPKSATATAKAKPSTKKAEDKKSTVKKPTKVATAKKTTTPIKK